MKEELSEKDEILAQIKFMKDASLDQLVSVFKDCIFLCIRCLFTFGSCNKLSKECLDIAKEMYYILKKEKELLSLVEDSIDSVDLDEAVVVIDTLDRLNDTTYDHFDVLLSDIEYSCDVRSTRGYMRMKERENNLLTNDEYQQKVEKLTNKKLEKKK